MGAEERRSSVSNFEVCPAYVSKVSNPGGAGNLGHRTHGHSVLWIKQQSVHLSGEVSWLREGFRKNRKKLFIRGVGGWLRTPL